MSDRTCIADGCERDWYVKHHRMCSMHYQRFMRTGTTDLPTQTVKTCKVDGCEANGTSGHGWCNKHYKRWRQHGTTDLPNGEVQWWHADRATAPTVCTVEGCGRPYKASGMCAMHWNRNKRQTQQQAMCAWCWELFTTRRRNQKLCSDRCAVEVRLEYGRGYQKTLRATDPDRTAYQREHRRALLLACRSVPFKRSDVFERDGWICQLCHEPVDPEIKHPARRSVSLDHIIPLARGGDHVYENAQTAHLSCNQEKGGRYI
jgi:hypothetical protein